jgi:hypothetical protein
LELPKILENCHAKNLNEALKAHAPTRPTQKNTLSSECKAEKLLDEVGSRRGMQCMYSQNQPG